MKKTLLAAALIAGYAGAASAQNSVTLYGVVDLGLEYQSIHAPDGTVFLENDKSSMSRFRMDSGQQSSSRWGLKGVEDLGNGLKASFVYESGITATTGASSGFTRQATLGLASDSWGSLQMGRAVSPGTVAFAGIDPMGHSYGTSAYSNSQGNTFIRYSNMISYASPDISGFKGLVGYSFDPGLDSNSEDGGFATSNKNRVASSGIRYANGPVLVSGIFDYVWSNDLNTSGSESDTNIKSWAIGGTFDFKVAKLHASYGQMIDGYLGASSLAADIVGGGDGNLSDGAFFEKGARTQSWMVGLSAPVGSGKVFGSVQQRLVGGDFKEDRIVGDLSLATGTMTTASIGYTYNFSKRTNLYAYYSYVNNVANLEGAKSNTVGVGLRHLF